MTSRTPAESPTGSDIIFSNARTSTMASLLGNRKYRDVALQSGFIAILGVLIVAAVVTARRNLETQGVNLSWDFLSYTTGSTIAFTLIDYDITSTYGRALLVGFLNTLLLGAITISLSVFLGTLIGTARLSTNKLVRWMAAWYVQIFRNLPLILQAFFWYALVTHLPPPKRSIALPGDIHISNRGVYLPSLNIDLVHFGLAVLMVLVAIVAMVPIARRFGRTPARLSLAAAIAIAAIALYLGRIPGTDLLTYPELKGLRFVGGAMIIPELTAACVAISLFGASYVAEIVRGGFLAIPKGQTEAAHALGLRGAQIFWRIKLPLMIRIILPTMTNQIIWLMKATTVGIAIGYSDFFAVVATSINSTGQTLALIFILVMGFWAINMTISVVMNAVNSAIAIPGYKK